MTDPTGPLRIGALGVVPSPYQRDLFAALAARGDVALRVHYLEAAAPDSPWPDKPLAAHERVLRGRWLAMGTVRWHQCEPMPDIAANDFLIVNSYMSSTAQALMRQRAVPWAFWGERLRAQHGAVRTVIQRVLTAPLGRARFIAAIGTLAARDYAARLPGRPTVNIPYFCDIDAFRDRPARPGSRPGPSRVLFCGQMIARKGIDLLIDAFARVAGAGADAELVLIGREAGLDQWLAPLADGLRGRIHYRGFLPPEDLPAEFARADLFVLPSRHDGWGVVVNQALAAGLPLLASDAVGAAHDLIVDGRNGRIIPSGDSDALARVLGELLADPTQLAAMGARSRRMADSWTPAAGAGRWVDAIRGHLDPA